jgi:hypothetical protein
MESGVKKPARKKSASKSSSKKPGAGKPAAKQPVKVSKVSEEDIKKMAHQIYIARQKNGIGGDEASDWLIAEYIIFNPPVLK